MNRRRRDARTVGRASAEQNALAVAARLAVAPRASVRPDRIDCFVPERSHGPLKLSKRVLRF